MSLISHATSVGEKDLIDNDFIKFLRLVMREGDQETGRGELFKRHSRGWYTDGFKKDIGTVVGHFMSRTGESISINLG